MKAIGITCGIGSMLIGARAAGFKIEGNVEWRKYYHEKDAHGRNTFEQNFPEAIFPHNREQMTEEEFLRFSNADLALGHPECGNFSRLSGANRNRTEKMFDPADIPLFVDLVAQFKPRYFVMDDLPLSFLAYPMAKYAEKLPEYDLFPEWISNWGYGNIQKGRDRMFMLGARREEGWTFVPGEQEHSHTVASTIGDLPTPRAGSNYPNHDPMDDTLDCFRALNMGEYRKKNSWAEVREYFRDKGGGFTLEYHPSEESKVQRIADGKDPIVKRIGFLKGHWDGPSHVLTGGNAALHFHRCEPYTVRERARIQGFPDDFVFYGTTLDSDGRWNHDLNQHMVRQTGKAMPVQFCTYISKQIAAKIKGEEFTSSRRRVSNPNDYVTEAKKWYCSQIGYSKQESACGECWLARTCNIRTEKYGLPAIAGRRSAPPSVAAAPIDRLTRTISSPVVAKPIRPVREYEQVETKVTRFGG